MCGDEPVDNSCLTSADVTDIQTDTIRHTHTHTHTDPTLPLERRDSGATASPAPAQIYGLFHGVLLEECRYHGDKEIMGESWFQFMQVFSERDSKTKNEPSQTHRHAGTATHAHTIDNNTNNNLDLYCAFHSTQGRFAHDCKRAHTRIHSQPHTHNHRHMIHLQPHNDIITEKGLPERHCVIVSCTVAANLPVNP